MADLTQAQVDAALSALAAEFDAAIAHAQAASYWFTPGEPEQIVGAITASKANELRGLQATATNHPEQFASYLAQAEKDLTDLSGYAQQATATQILADTATQTVQDVQDDAAAAAKAVNSGLSFVLKTAWAAIPFAVKVAAGVAAVGGALYLARPLLFAKHVAAEA